MAALIKPDSLQILLETISPVGRVLHDALNKQIFLETILLKAMREAHAVRISDILARLNQLRSAGELTFLDKLPTVERNIADVSPNITSVVSVVPAVPAEAKEAKEPEKEVVPVQEVISAAEENNISTIENSEKVDDVVVEKTAVAAEEIAQADDDSAEKIVKENVSSINCDNIEESAPVETFDNEEEIIPPVEESSFTQTIPAVQTLTEIKTPAQRSIKELAPQQNQHSIANDNPQALKDIAQNNTVVQEVLDLFSGTVVDIHQ